jgi:uncharacterized protein
MKLIDANVLIYASHSEAADHGRYFDWLKNLYQSGEAWAQCELIAAAFLRITTNPTIWDAPFSIDEALLAYDDIRSRSQCRWLTPAADHWSVFSKLCKVTLAHSNLVNDAWLAALALEHDCELISTDGDFGKFPGLHWRHPLAPS